MARLKPMSSDARALWLARFRRRARICAALALDALAFRKGARALAPAMWAFAVSFIWLLAQVEQMGWFALPSLVLFLCLLVLALIDARYFVVPDGPLVVLGVTGAAMRLLSSPQDVISYFGAAAFAFVTLRAAAWAFEKLRGVPGLGQGDARLFALAGLWLGWDGLPSCLLIAALSASLAAVIALRDGALAHFRDPLPFGPHIALGFWLVWAIGPLKAV